MIEPAPEPVLWVAAMLLLIAATIVGAAESVRGRPPRWGMALCALAAVPIAGLGALLVASDGPGVALSGGRVADFVPIDVRYDAMSGVFVLALGLVGLATAAGGWDGLTHSPSNAATAVAFPTFLLSLLLVFGSANAFAFLLAWEVMALSSAVLVVGARPVPEQVAAGYLYLAVTHLATAALVVGFAVLAAAAGGDLSFAAWPAAAASLPTPARDIVFGLLLLGFLTKAGAIPVHVWLPRAHPAAPSHVSALMSGVMIKTGIFGVLRLGLEVLGPGPDGWGLIVLLVGVISAAFGVLYALMEHDLKRLLAFHSVENIGIILLGVGAAMLLAAHDLRAAASFALAAALFHSLNHGLFKALLFLAAGGVQAAAGTRNLNRLGGLWRGMPRTAVLFGIGAAAISGLPPLNGFASEWLTFHGLLGAGTATDLSPVARTAAFIAVGGLALTAALAVACFVKATGLTFLALPRSDGAERAHEAGRGELAGMTLLAALCVGLGFAAGAVAARLTSIAGTLVRAPAIAQDPVSLTAGPALPGAVAPALLGLFALVLVAAALLALRRGRLREAVRVAPTWTCGVAPTAEMEYTATSYSKLIRLFFRRILLPQRELHIDYHAGTPLPATMRYEGEVTHVLEEQVFRPLHGVSVRFSSEVRRLQNGSLQLYLAYALVAFVLLLAVAR